MSVNVDLQVVGPGDDTHVETAWRLKEDIRLREGVLKQRRGFFTDAYRRSTVHLLFLDDRLVGFAATRRDGYLLFLAVDPEYRGQGFGERLVDLVAEDHRAVTCHARTTNEEALSFYDHLGFEIVRRIDNYYEDAGDSFYLKRGNTDGIAGRLSAYLHR
ncbi:GNAT family N-acetyltransferase [Halalkalicoccus jeotgali]|uniref:GCN5-like N-acetyltransferase n=1 Tax=Halalkalicoccus jeotgali (strain DSM 18796 / CECT 7217 / JCM 14584 / KCTC 4019 / B3) TaxID=795797 RepID=D8J299_HALJB|nr:N-acetyltransferase [Halalkalicoccus jeotgali]ADJ14856.1 GCN5-related N-acetyltransferase [Halalkalicoccus jeotgali B3]ELY39438.1 GCN5-like N-acetyltransferase [Halalkalicoccus jeotgali B3]